ncbi:MAG: efflux RND transporter periplasmic adaptor subunit [Tagaea sp.]
MNAEPPPSQTVQPVPPAQAALRRLSAAIDLQRRARAAGNFEELAFVAANETALLVPYRQAVLLTWEGKRLRPSVASGLARMDRDAPYTVWLAGAFGTMPAFPSPRRIGADDLPGGEGAQWGQYLPAHAVCVPLARANERLGALLVARDEPFADAELAALDIAGAAFAHAWSALATKGAWRVARKASRFGRAATIVLGLAAISAGFVPVRESVLAPAEIVPREAAVVRSALDGVVERVAVRPNEAVRAGQLLATLDARRIDSQIDVARKALEAAEAELRQATQAAVFDPRARAGVASLRGRTEQAAAELAYQLSLRERVEIKAPREGIAVFDDASDFVGRPLAIGERLMLVADPAAIELEIRLPVGDAIRLEPGADVRFFLNIDPQRPIGAALSFAAYRASPGPDGTLSYRLKARFAEDEARERLRIGLKGTARILGEEVPLAIYLFRRPIAAMRQWAGL